MRRVMPGRKARWILGLVIVSLALPTLGLGRGLAQEGSRAFPETGKTVAGKFLVYWNSHGGLQQQGYPLSEQMQETSDTNGKLYTVQYFERAIFEQHPENSAPYDVLLSLLGDFRYKQKYPTGAPGQAANHSAGAVTFKETGKTVGGTFLSYWNNHGGLQQQGFPISEEFQERSYLDGKLYTVQYFERAVFELHPDNSAPYTVLLSQLGTFRYKERHAVAAGPTALPTPTLVPLSAQQRLDVFQQVWELVRDRYVYTDFRGLNWPAIHDEYAAKIKAAGSEEDVYNLIGEMIEKLGDHHSAFANPRDVKDDDALQRGDLKLSGIGVISQQIEKAVRIVYVIPGSPAERAGLRPFDVIQAVNGIPLLQNGDAPRLIRGPAGTTVVLTVASPNKAPRDVSIVRENVTFSYHATDMRLPGTNIAYLNMPTFNTFGIAQEVHDELTKLASSGPIDGLIIDERQNGGGLLSELQGTLKLFIDGGNAGFEATRESRQADTIPAGQTLPALRGKPIVVLVSGLCESACERFAVAMHDRQRATIVGTTTAGNTETVYPYNLNDGSRLYLASATYQRPDGTSIEDKGLVPDATVDVPWYQYTLDQDPQVLQAEKNIRGK